MSKRIFEEPLYWTNVEGVELGSTRNKILAKLPDGRRATRSVDRVLKKGRKVELADGSRLSAGNDPKNPHISPGLPEMGECFASGIDKFFGVRPDRITAFDIVNSDPGRGGPRPD